MSVSRVLSGPCATARKRQQGVKPDLQFHSLQYQVAVAVCIEESHRRSWVMRSSEVMSRVLGRALWARVQSDLPSRTSKEYLLDHCEWRLLSVELLGAEARVITIICNWQSCDALDYWWSCHRPEKRQIASWTILAWLTAASNLSRMAHCTWCSLSKDSPCLLCFIFTVDDPPRRLRWRGEGDRGICTQNGALKWTALHHIHTLALFAISWTVIAGYLKTHSTGSKIDLHAGHKGLPNCRSWGPYDRRCSRPHQAEQGCLHMSDVQLVYSLTWSLVLAYSQEHHRARGSWYIDV